MLFRLLRALKFCFFALGRPICFGLPPRRLIVILEESSHEYLLPLLGKESFEIIGNPSGTTCLNFRFVGLFFANLFKVERPEVAYALTLLKFIQPKIALSLIDNSDFFYNVSRHAKGVRFLAIQNANRIDSLFLPKAAAAKIHIPEYACFGQYEVDMYTAIGATVGHFFPVGCLKDALYRDSLSGTPEKSKTYDVCLVSEGAQGTDEEWGPGVEKAMVLILEHAIRFCAERGLRFCIAGKRPDLKYFELEKAMYTKYVSEDIPFIRPARFEHSTAKLIDSSKVSLASCSTALKEAFSRGNKVLFCNFTGDSRLDFPVQGVWLLNDPSFEAFEQRMFVLLGMTVDEFNDGASSAVQYVMKNDPQIPATAFLRNLISNAVASGKSVLDKQ